MRGVLMSLVIMAGLALVAPRPASAALASGTSLSATSASDSFQTPAKDVTVDINVNQGGGRWYRSPVWIAIGAIAAVVVLLLIVLVARGGGGTTIVRE